MAPIGLRLAALLALCASSAGYAPAARTVVHQRAMRGSRACTVHALEPVSTAAAAFAAGLVPPSFLLLGKEGELQDAKSEAAAANAELSRLRAGFSALIATMEVDVDVADAELDDLLAAGQRATQQRTEELQQLRGKYEEQIKQLKNLMGDYTDKLELQQNSFKRVTMIAESAQSESLALKERAKILEDRLAAANEQLAKVMAEAEGSASNPLAAFFKLFNPS